MTPPWPWRGLSIYGRTFLLMLAALVVAEAVGLAFIVYRPPTNDEPITLAAVARFLRQPSDTRGHDRPPFDTRGPQSRSGPDASSSTGPSASGGPGSGTGPPSGTGPGSNIGPAAGTGPGSEPGSGPLGRNGPPFGGPPGPPPDGFAGGPPPDALGPPPESNLGLSFGRSLTAPGPMDSGLLAAPTLRTRLALLLGVDPNDTVLFATGADELEQGDNPLLRKSFIASRKVSDGSWRNVSRVVEGFPNALHRRAMLLFALGAATLLPFAWVFARALSAPIRRFSEAAQRLGRDPNAPLLPREGPTEMLVAVDSFNSMQARLNRLVQERTHMVGAIAHDLRTPLTRLAFRLDDLPHPLREKVDADIQEMKSMISAALDFIRDRSLGGQQERLDFRLLVESVVDDQSDLGHDVSLQPGTPLTIEGNPLALRRMVSNLVDNALKYGERARLRVRSAGEHCVLEIDDDGPGIPEQLRDQVFEPFVRLETSRNRNTGGIGLGLAAVRAIVLEHGGEITLGNRKDGGLRVTVSLPSLR